MAKDNAPVEEEILDFSDVRPFEPLDSSKMYLVEVTSLETGLSANSGRKTVAAEFTIRAPEEVSAEEWAENDDGELQFVGLSDRMIKVAGRKLFRNFSLQPQALPFLYNFLKACDPEVELNEAFRLVPAEWIGSKLAVKGHNEAYEEQVRLRPDKMYPKARYSE